MTPLKLSADDFTYTNGIKIKRTKLNKPGILFAYASWCGACASAHPKVEALSNSARNHTVYEIDADQEQIFGTRANITHFPTFFYVAPDGRIQPLEETNIQNVVDSVCRKYSQCITQTGGSRKKARDCIIKVATLQIDNVPGGLEGPVPAAMIDVAGKTLQEKTSILVHVLCAYRGIDDEFTKMAYVDEKGDEEDRGRRDGHARRLLSSLCSGPNPPYIYTTDGSKAVSTGGLLKNSCGKSVDSIIGCLEKAIYIYMPHDPINARYMGRATGRWETSFKLPVSPHYVAHIDTSAPPGCSGRPKLILYNLLNLDDEYKRVKSKLE
jgi:thiol-disulfide isomerase/thioredoxin